MKKTTIQYADVNMTVDTPLAFVVKPPWRRFMDLNVDMMKLLFKGLGRLGRFGSAIGGLKTLWDTFFGRQRQPAGAGQI